VGARDAGCLSTAVSVREADMASFYRDAYAPSADAELHGRWRALSAIAKAQHIVELATGVGLDSPAAVADVGCGDGSVLSELGRRGFGARRIGFEIAAAAVEMAAGRPEIDDAAVFDGAHVPAADGAYDLAYASHVLEHVPSPAVFLSELTRIARAVVVEVPLERNLSARRPAARLASEAAGHVQRFDRAAIRGLIDAEGWRVRGEIVDPLGRDVHLFGREALGARTMGVGKWAARTALAAVPAVGTRVVTMHYAVIATPALG
jgi:SAM-dependent methyltransferase